MGYLETIAGQFGIAAWLIAIILIWSIGWKLLALWKSARKGHLAWFIVMGLINFVGIIEILYIFVFSKMKFCNPSVKKPAKKKKKR